MGKPDFPPASFTPPMLGYTGQGAFRYWCQTALPLVYDDSLSYYELLNKVVVYLNNLISDVSNAETNIDSLLTAYNELQDYVNAYFTNIDIQDEINNKLDEMASSGQLTEIISPFIPGLVSEWLNEHITPTTPIIDNTLTISGAAADAEKTGKLIAPVYNSAHTYDVGDYVNYNGTIYKCIIAITTAENWTPGHWTATNAETELTDLKNASKSIHQSIINNLELPFRFSPSSNDPLTIIDDNGNILVRVAEAFDTSKINPSISDYSRYVGINYNFQIIDENGNIGFAIVNGLAITNQRLSGKKLSILGDSISTFQDYIPNGYATYYPHGNLDKVYETWWYKLAEELNMTILKNASWSGSRVSGDSQGNAYAGCSTARISDLADNDETPDIIIVYISTNDWANNVPIGNFTNKSSIPDEGTITEISKAYALMLYKIRTTYPDATVYCVTNLEGRSATSGADYPITNSNGETIHDVNHAITEIAHIFGCHVIDLNVSGIHFWNLANYTVDQRLHPNEKGAEIIKEVIKLDLIKTYHNI